MYVNTQDFDNRSENAANRVITLNRTLKELYVKNDDASSALRTLSVKAWLRDNKRYALAYYRDLFKYKLEKQRQEYIDEHESDEPERMNFD